MKFKELVDNLNKIIADNPDSLEYYVIYKSDYQGVEFKNLSGKPSVGFYGDGYFPSEEHCKYNNVICIN